MTMASWEVSSPITEQLHCKGPTRSISWIIYLLIVARGEGETPSRQSAGAGAAVLGSARAFVVGTCAGNASGRQYVPRVGEGLWRSTVSMVIRIAITNRAKDRERRLAGARRRLRKIIVLAPGPSIYPARGRFHGARSAARCCRECQRAGNVRSAGSS